MLIKVKVRTLVSFILAQAPRGSLSAVSAARYPANITEPVRSFVSGPGAQLTRDML